MYKVPPVAKTSADFFEIEKLLKVSDDPEEKQLFVKITVMNTV